MPKNIVFCADGTWNHPGETEDGLPADTNVYKFYKALQQSATQEPHYDDGVGSDGTPIDRHDGGAMGIGLFKKIKDGYTVIARSYDDGDGIHLIGFSRGAYTARSLAGMIAVCGLPSPGTFTAQAADEAFAAYRAGANRKPLLDAFTAKYDARDVKIAMVGVWDTVGARSIPGNLFADVDARLFGFLDTGLHPDVRRPIRPTPSMNAEMSSSRRFGLQRRQDVDQVWFAGVHADVGGGYAQTGLSDIAIAWIMEKAVTKGLKFDQTVLDSYATLPPQKALGQIHTSWNVGWGFPTRRTIAAGSTIANSVAIRMQHGTDCRPPNIPSTFPAPESGMRIEKVIADPPAV